MIKRNIIAALGALLVTAAGALLAAAPSGLPSRPRFQTVTVTGSGAASTGNGIFASAANTLNFATNGVDRGGITSAGVWTVNAPTAGISMNLLGNGAQEILMMQTTGDVTASGTAFARIKDQNGAANAAYLGFGGTASQFDIYNYKNGPIAFYPNGTLRATLNTGLQLGAPTGGDKGAGTINTAGPIYQNGSLVQETGSFTATAVGLTTSPTGTVNWARAGNIVVLSIPSITGTSNSTSFSLTGLPANLQPTRTATMRLAYFFDNAVVVQDASVQVNPASGTMLFLRGNQLTGFTNGNVKGTLDVQSVTYILN